jgi:hypothetical protein
MKIDVQKVKSSLKGFDFATLFREHLGWDRHDGTIEVMVDGRTFLLEGFAQKRGFAAFQCPAIPDRSTRMKIDHKLTRSVREHFVVYTDKEKGNQVWQWVRREKGKPVAGRDYKFHISQSGDDLVQRLEHIAVDIEEEEDLTVVDVAGKTRAAFDVDKVTKKFYERFKAEHTAFQKLISGIGGENDLKWYTSLMMNRLMFVYFIQKKGFLDGDTDYLRNRLTRIKNTRGKDRFQSFYRYFLLRLFHEGLGKSPNDRKLDADMESLLGDVPYLNGGFFEVHNLEVQNPDIDIPDKAFEKLFDFFDQYAWHLDERPIKKGNEINPDVVGYIFEKYINQKEMGAYYTKEDITEYISKSTIIPFLFSKAEKYCAVAFEPESFLWRLIRDDPDRYIYEAVRHGVINQEGVVIPLPEYIEAGIHDVSKREGWNRYAPEEYGLPTETWREYIERRKHCLDTRERMAKGDVYRINDFVTLNLDIWQFARDVIVNAEGPELLRAFWKALSGLTVLDPTCGSGAFLFAALRILETLYSDAIERMRRFIEDGEDRPHHPEQYHDFRGVLEQLSKHPSERYFILKSIIIQNLYGVDIMEEAVEIAKLRLFLKLVAQVEQVKDLEPLPDVDFNIRSGNTLVGYTSIEEVKKSREHTLGFDAEQVERIEEDAEIVERAFTKFREQQTLYGGKVTREDKEELRKRLRNLDEQLNRFLSADYGIDRKNFTNDKTYEEAYRKWLTSHQPFHWIVEFYGIMHTGGFDVIIGNPPYVEYSKVKKHYTIRNYSTESCGNLYANVLERSSKILRKNGLTGMIIPHSAICTDRMVPLQYLIDNTSNNTWISTYGIRPAKLFNGVDQRLCIYLSEKRDIKKKIFTTKYNRWNEKYRSQLFNTVEYVQVESSVYPNTIQKLYNIREIIILGKIMKMKNLNTFIEDKRGSIVYFHNAPRYWIRAMNFTPYFWNERYGEQISTQMKKLVFKNNLEANVVVSVLNSSLFYWWFVILSDCRHLNMREIENFPVGLDVMSEDIKKTLAELADELMIDLDKHKNRKEAYYKTTGKVIYDEFFPKYSKPIIDEIDRVLARHYGFTEEELDFIINYDIKYRMGAEDEDGEE